MKKIFTLAIAVLASFSLWADEETFTFEWTAAGTKGFSYSQAGPANGAMLTGNALYFISNDGPKVEDSNLNPYRVGFIFSPAVNVSLKIKGAAGSSDRILQNIKIDKDIDARFFKLCKDAVGSDKTVMQYALDNALDEDKKYYSTVGILKESKGQYSVAGDSKAASGQTEQALLYAERVAANNIKFPKNGEVEEMLTTGTPAEDFIFEAGKYYRIYTEVSSSTGAKLLSFTFVTAAPACNAPEKELVLKADKEVIYVGDEVTFSTEGGNGNPVTIVGANGNVITTGKWVATEGKHTFQASQEAAGDVCAQESFLELTVLTKNPVTAVSVDGPKEAYVGAELVYSATAANATQYAWLVDGVDANTNAAEFKYTAVVGEHSIVCKARNDFNATDEWIASAELKLVVTAICGELIKAELKGGNSANVTGIIGGTFDSNLSSGKYKLDKKVYIGVVLKDGATFAEGDIFNINTSAAAGQGTMAIYGDKAGTDLIYQAEEGNYGVAGNNEIELPAAANGKTALYLYRPDDATAWNPTVAYISVTRECSKEPKLSVSPASVKLAVIDTQAQPKEKVVFSGKYLTPGTYNLDLQPIAGLSVSPTSVTVDADGKLNAEVILTYENAADAEAATSLLTLTIGEKSAQVQVTCSAKHGKQYIKSVNIEQWILDNGKNNAAFNDVLADANIEYLNINGLDSLDDGKGAGRNEPYLGLKLKKKGAKIAGYLKKGEDAIKVKFGYVSDSLTLGINGEYRTLRKEEAAEILWLGVNPAIDRYVEIITTTDATVVIKQIMVNEDIAEVVLPEGATAIENTEAAVKAVKVVRNGQVLIIRDGKMYNALGAEVK